MKKIAVIGTVGVPAKYGGFETLVENMLGENCAPNVKYTVYCSSKAYAEKRHEYKGATLKYVPLKANGAQSILYDIISIIRALPKHNTLLILGVSGCLILPVIKFFTGKRIVVNIDGLEHKRDKWSPKIRKFLKWSEKIAVRNADVIISDNKAIQDYVKKEYGVDSELIAYGGDHVVIPSVLSVTEYSFGLCRIEPENNVHTILEAFADSQQKLIFVGNWKNSKYGIDLKEKYGTCRNIELLDPIYDLETLGNLRGQCRYYIHGHSAGGTNPSLVEAMFFAKPILAFDVRYNRESTENKATYFANAQQLKTIIEAKNELNDNASAMLEIAQRRYRWQTIAKQYEKLYS